jgi:hypothetical protein
VPDRETAVRLTRRGIAATSFDTILAAPDEATAGYFIDEDPAVLVPDRQSVRRAELVAVRLQRLGILYRLVREQSDRRP